MNVRWCAAFLSQRLSLHLLLGNFLYASPLYVMRLEYNAKVCMYICTVSSYHSLIVLVSLHVLARSRNSALLPLSPHKTHIRLKHACVQPIIRTHQNWKYVHLTTNQSHIHTVTYRVNTCMWSR